VDIDLFEFDFGHMAVAISAIVIAYTLKGFSGFGAGLIAIPILSLVFHVTIVVPVVNPLSFSANLIQSFKLRYYTCWPDIWPLIPFCLFGLFLPVWLLVNISSNHLALAMGLFVIAYALYSLFPAKPLKGPRLWAIPFGELGGFIGALFGSSGFVYVTYLKLRPMNKAQFRATVAMALALDGMFRISAYVSSGLFTTRVMILVGLLLPILLLSIKLGNHLNLYISHNRFNLMVSTLLIVRWLCWYINQFNFK
jgi:uncharacterized membrane protein YfcA